MVEKVELDNFVIERTLPDGYKTLWGIAFAKDLGKTPEGLTKSFNEGDLGIRLAHGATMVVYDNQEYIDRMKVFVARAESYQR